MTRSAVVRNSACGSRWRPRFTGARPWRALHAAALTLVAPLIVVAAAGGATTGGRVDPSLGGGGTSNLGALKSAKPAASAAPNSSTETNSVAALGLPKAFGTAVIDGLATPGEWDAAARQDVGLQRAASEGGGVLPANLYLMNDESNVYLGLRVARATAANSGVSYWFSDAPSPAVDSMVLNPDLGFSDLFGGSFDTDLGGTQDGAGRAIADGGATFYEISHPLDSADDTHDISVKPGDTISLSLFFRYIDPCNDFPRCFGDTAVNGLKLFVLRKGVTLMPPTFTVAWTRSVATGGIHLVGYAREPAQLTVTASGPTPFKKTIPASAGDLDEQVPVPPDLLPGTYRVTVTSLASGVESPAGASESTLEAPPEGIVNRSWVSLTPTGRAVASVPASTSRIWAHFSFRQPAAERVKLSWYNPRGRRVANDTARNGAAVVAPYRAPKRLSRGIWHVSISAHGRVAGDLRFRVN